MNKRFAPQMVNMKAIDRENFQIRFVMSTPEIDRHGEVIDQRGWDFTPYMKNPVVLWGHDQSIPAVGKVVAIENVDGNTEGVVKFAVKENPDAKVLFELYAEGYMSAVSVGFMNRKWMYDEEKDIITLLDNELFELSLVNVPANASALSKAKTKGFDIGVIDRLNKTVEEDKKGEEIDVTKERKGDRFKDLGEEVDADEGDGDIDDEITPEKDPEDLEEETAAPSKTVEGEEGADDETKAALETLFKKDKTTIKASVKELESHLNDAGTEGKSETAPSVKKGFSNTHINRLIASLLASKSSPGNL